MSKRPNSCPSMDTARIHPSFTFGKRIGRTLSYTETLGKIMPDSPCHQAVFTINSEALEVLFTSVDCEHCCLTAILDMFNFQFALLGEAVETDFQTVRTVRFKKSLRDGEHSHYKARIQLWRELDDDTEVLASVPSVAPTVTREAWQRPNIKVHTTRVVMYWDETITTFFVTDSIQPDLRARRCCVKIKPSSHKTFQNPSNVKARTFGSRDVPGGFRLDKKGLFPDDEENFEEFKWFEIEFNTKEETENFHDEFTTALNIRRKERWQAEELMRLAKRGVPAGAEVSVSGRK